MTKEGNNGEYYAKGRTVHKSPTEKPSGQVGVQRWEIGFPVCTLSEYLDDEAAVHIANALNAFEARSSAAPAMEKAS